MVCSKGKQHGLITQTQMFANRQSVEPYAGKLANMKSNRKSKKGAWLELGLHKASGNALYKGSSGKKERADCETWHWSDSQQEEAVVGGGGGLAQKGKSPQRNSYTELPGKRRVLWKWSADMTEVVLSKGMMLVDWHSWQWGQTLAVSVSGNWSLLKAMLLCLCFVPILPFHHGHYWVGFSTLTFPTAALFYCLYCMYFTERKRVTIGLP